MKREIYAIISAGGSGTRMGAAVPKQFLELKENICILQMSIEAFIDAVPDVKIVTVLPKDQIDTWKEYCLKRNFQYPQMLVEGGITRFHSVRNALARIPDGALVAVHDAVRPFVSKSLICNMLTQMDGCRALIPVVPVTDTLKMVRKSTEGLCSLGIPAPDRNTVWGAQTPQMFLSDDLKMAYQKAYDPLYTDDASVADACGIPLNFIEGERFNIKITTKEDLVFAKAIMESFSKLARDQEQNCASRIP